MRHEFSFFLFVFFFLCFSFPQKYSACDVISQWSTMTRRSFFFFFCFTLCALGKVLPNLQHSNTES